MGVSLSALIVFFISSPVLVIASHSAGGEISYTHISGSTYNIRFVFFRDCFGISAPTSASLSVSSVSCNINQAYTLVPLPGTGMDVVLPCPVAVTTCNGGLERGIQKWEYGVNVVLSGQCPDWIFSVTICCRNYASTCTGGGNLYVEARLNNANGDNNSPQFTNNPFVAACINQNTHYNNGMYDADGDSLVYRLIDARNDANTSVSYIPPNSGQQPFISVPPITFDYFTGDLIMHPITQETGPIVFEVLDYRNGELMGSVMREIMMYTQACINESPTATEMNGTSQQIAYVFPNDTICFDIFSDDPDAGNVLTMTWNQVIPSAAFTVTGAQHPTGTFCWTPVINDVRSQPYMFTAMIRDDNCPLNNAGIYSYYIYVTLDSSLVFLNTDSREESFSYYPYPNPSSGLFTVESSHPFSFLKIYNALGECILDKTYKNTVDLSNMQPGLYFIEVVAPDGKSKLLKMVKE